mgnify:CR=1 FL=1
MNDNDELHELSEEEKRCYKVGDVLFRLLEAEPESELSRALRELRRIVCHENCDPEIKKLLGVPTVLRLVES